MKNNIRENTGEYTIGFGVSLAVTTILNSILVICKESNPAIKAWMKAATSHHWISHALILLVVYVGLGLLLTKAKIGRKVSSEVLLVSVTIAIAVGCAGIVGFYLKHLIA